MALLPTPLNHVLAFLHVPLGGHIGYKMDWENWSKNFQLSARKLMDSPVLLRCRAILHHRPELSYLD
eukprot:2312082-Karenia_brevis.AAC.1